MGWSVLTSRPTVAGALGVWIVLSAFVVGLAAAPQSMDASPVALEAAVAAFEGRLQ